MFSHDRTELRAVFFRAWQNYREHRPLEGIESIIVDVALRHPEYHALLDAAEIARDRDYHPTLGDPNPFMHMGLHIAIVEQLSTDQPPGVRRAFQRLSASANDAHHAEHAMMDCLGETLWQAQRAGRALDQAAYLECLNRLTPRT